MPPVPVQPDAAGTAERLRMPTADAISQQHSVGKYPSRLTLRARQCHSTCKTQVDRFFNASLDKVAIGETKTVNVAGSITVVDRRI